MTDAENKKDAAASKKPYEKPDIKSSTIKDTFLACGKCGSGPVEQFMCVVFPELS